MAGMAVASALLQVVFEKLAQGAIREFAQIWGVKDDLEKLESIISTVRDVLEDAEEQAVNNKSLSNWLWKLKDAAYDADDLLEEFQMETERRKAAIRGQLTRKVAHFFSLSNPLIFRFQMARGIKRIRARMDEIAAERRNFHLERRQPQDRQMVIKQRETWSQMDEMSIIGRDEDKESIMRMVMDSTDETEENVSIISIVGIGGMGKTTLAQLVYNEERVREKHFDLRIWVYVSMDFDPRRIGKAMMECITGQRCELENLDAISKQLEAKLTGKRFLIVLDDVWNENPSQWEKLKPIFNVGAKGSKIVVTTRGENMSSIMKATAIYPLKGLSEEDCWALFKERAFEGGNEEQDPSIVAIGKEIVNKCGGVPLAAKALGSVMRSKQGKDAWSDMRESCIWERADEDESLACLKLSYTHLPSHLKQCFAYCSIFKKGYKIDRDDLIAQWIAQGFISSTHGSRQMEDIGNGYFNNLLWLSFFQDLEETDDGRVTCKMHDLVHDLAQLVAGGEALLLGHKRAMTSIDQKHCRYLALICYDVSLEFPVRLKKMRALKLYNSSYFKPTHSMFSNAQCLRALDLREAHIVSLPISVNSLRNLRYLNVSCSKILSKSLYSLQNLQTLYLSNYGLQNLPESVGRLHNLRSLVLSDCDHLVTLPKSIGDLRDLRNLGVMQCPSLETVPESVGKLHNLRRINLSHCGDLMRLPSSIGDLHNLRTLDVMQCGRLLTAPESIGKLHNMQRINLSHCVYLKHLPESISNLLCLEKLDLRGCKGLEKLPQGLGNMINLRYLITNYCDSLRGMPLGVGRLTNLQALPWFVVGGSREHARVSELEHLKQINGELEIYGLRNVWDPEDARRAKLKEKQNLSSLSLNWIMPADARGNVELRLRKKGDEEAVLESLQPHASIKGLEISYYVGVSFPKWLRDLTSLHSLNIDNCPRLTRLPPWLQRLTTLRSLWIAKCPKLARRCKRERGKDWHIIAHIPKIFIDGQRI